MIFTRASRTGHRADEVGLAAEERGRLEDIHDTGHFGDFRLGVDVCQHRNADRLTDLLEDGEPFSTPIPRKLVADVRFALSKLALKM